VLQVPAGRPVREAAHLAPMFPPGPT
jgi:hypothetical protein